MDRQAAGRDCLADSNHGYYLYNIIIIIISYSSAHFPIASLSVGRSHFYSVGACLHLSPTTFDDYLGWYVIGSVLSMTIVNYIG